jgi:deazaflavin-dependent oxidoreductase (nitroreductase family)
MTSDMLSRLMPLDRPPTGWRRVLLRAPLALDSLHLNRLLGRRFVVIVHRGRRSGRLRRTPVEVVVDDRRDGSIVVASGWGRSAGWFRDLLAAGSAEVHHADRRFAATVHVLDDADAAAAMRIYADEHPAAARELGTWMLGRQFDASAGAIAALVERVPFVRLAPAPVARPT